MLCSRAPLLGNNLSIIGMQFADTVMAGQLGARDLAALAVGVGYYHLFLLIGLGVLMAVSPSVAHAYGANDTRGVTRYCRQAWWLALALAVVLVAGLLQVGRVLPAIGIAPEILPTAVGYVHAMSFGHAGAARVPGAALHERGPRAHEADHVLRLPRSHRQRDRQLDLHVRQVRHAAARCGRLRRRDGDLRVADVLRDAHVHAHGSARIASSISSRASIAPDWRVLRELTRIGAPIAGSVLAEGGLFVCAALMIGGMGATLTAGHQIALNYASFMFMVPLAISSATTIHVGHTLGRGDARARTLRGHCSASACARA